MTMTRIHGREGGIPTFDDLKTKMIRRFGIQATSITTVLDEMCKKYRLHNKLVDLRGAMEYLRLLNSWGPDWADYGFFKVKKAEVLGFKFIDIYWEADDLNKKEKNSFKELGSKRAKWLMEALPSLQRGDQSGTVIKFDNPVTSQHGDKS